MSLLLTSAAWPKAKRLVDAVNHTLLEQDLAQDPIRILAPSERSPHRERNGADRNGMTALKVLIVEGDDAVMLPSHVPIS